MNMMKILFIVVLFSLIRSQNAVAEFDPMYTVEDFQYEYKSTGVPHVNMQITNRGTKAEKLKIVIKLSEAVHTMLNDYDYELRATVRSNHNLTIIPNKRLYLSIKVNKPLKAGSYEALVIIRAAGVKEQNRFQFSLQ